jgi:hypothetical protein
MSAAIKNFVTTALMLKTSDNMDMTNINVQTQCLHPVSEQHDYANPNQPDPSGGVETKTAQRNAVSHSRGPLFPKTPLSQALTSPGINM